MRGEVLHQWSLPLSPGNYGYLLPSGNLLWSGRTDEGPPMRSGKGGLLREFDWYGNVVWEYRDDAQHHDFRRLRNGNTIYIGWEPMPANHATRIMGGQPGSERNGITYGDFIREISPAGEAVWEWHAYSDMELERYPMCPLCHRDEYGHANACSETPMGDILVSFRRLNLIAAIDHATNRFSWELRDNSWGHQHDCTMLENGNVLLFANGIHTHTNPTSRVVEVAGKSNLAAWEYRGSPTWTFFSPNISGAQRLWSGNTLICEGQMGRVFEITPAGEIVWEYICPFFAPYQGRGLGNCLFRAYRYAVDSPEIAGRLKTPVA